MVARKPKVAAAAAPVAGKNPLGLVTDTKALGLAIVNVHRVGQKYHDQLHIVAVSVILHAAEHGQVALLNQFYDGLSKAYQSGFKQWAAKLAGDSPHPAGRGQGNGWLKMEKNQFAIITDRMGPRVKDDDSFKNRIDAVFKGTKFWERSLDGGIGQAFGPEQVLSRLASLLSAIEKPDNAAKIDPAIAATIREAMTKVDAMIPANPGAGNIH